MHFDPSLLCIAAIVVLAIASYYFRRVPNKTPPELPSLYKLLGTNQCLVGRKSETGSEKVVEDLFTQLLELLAATSANFVIANDLRRVESPMTHAESLASDYGDCWCMLLSVINAPIDDRRYASFLVLSISTPEYGKIGYASVPIIGDSTLMLVTQAYKIAAEDAKQRMAKITEPEPNSSSVRGEIQSIS